MSEAILAAVQLGANEVELREFPTPTIGPDEGLLRVERCGVCGSDVEQLRGDLSFVQYPLVPGHEAVGIVVEVGVRAAGRWGVEPGDRVAVESFVPCGCCSHCLSGGYTLCSNSLSHGYTPTSVAPAVWGAFSQFMYLHPRTIVHKISKTVPPEVAVLYNPLGAGVRWACHLPEMRMGDTVVLFGAGQRGLSCVIAARAAGAGLVVITGLTKDRHKLALAYELGVDIAIDVEREDTVERVREVTGGALADVVVDTTPYATQPVRDAVDVVKPGGTIVLAGLKGGRSVPDFPSDSIVMKGASVRGAYGVDAAAYRQAIRIIESGSFPVEKLHTHTFGLEQTKAAIEMLAHDVDDEEPIAVSVAPHGGGTGS